MELERQIVRKEEEGYSWYVHSNWVHCAAIHIGMSDTIGNGSGITCHSHWNE